MTKKNLVCRVPFKKDACVICGKRLNPKYADVGIGDRCYKAAKKKYPSLFDESGKIIKEKVTEDIRLDLMEFMRGSPKANSPKKVCYCVEEKHEDDVVDIILDEEECPCEGDE